MGVPKICDCWRKFLGGQKWSGNGGGKIKIKIKPKGKKIKLNGIGRGGGEKRGIT